MPSVKSFWIGLPFVLAGAAIRLWSAGYLNKMSNLTTAGPFSLCRNPLYVGSFLICIGYLVMSGRIEVLIVGIFLFWMFHGGAIAYEEKLLKEKFGQSFVDYCNSVPRFFPVPRSLKGEGSFSIKQVLYNNEYRSLTASIAVSILFALIAYMPDFAPLQLLK